MKINSKFLVLRGKRDASGNVLFLEEEIMTLLEITHHYGIFLSSCGKEEKHQWSHVISRVVELW